MITCVRCGQPVFMITRQFDGRPFNSWVNGAGEVGCCATVDANGIARKHRVTS